MMFNNNYLIPFFIAAIGFITPPLLSVEGVDTYNIGTPRYEGSRIYSVDPTSPVEQMVDENMSDSDAPFEFTSEEWENYPGETTCDIVEEPICGTCEVAQPCTEDDCGCCCTEEFTGLASGGYGAGGGGGGGFGFGFGSFGGGGGGGGGGDNGGGGDGGGGKGGGGGGVPVPEPGTWLLMTGMVSAASYLRKKKQK